MKEWNLNTAELRAHAKEIKVGDMVNLSGTIYTARDAAHKRLFAMLDEGKDLPFDVKDAVIYYVGPPPRQSRAKSSAPSGPPLRAAWTPMHPACWIWALWP